MAKDKELLQWHPAFFAGLQIELQEDTDHLTFLNEYQLGTKPKQIDVLVIKKEANYTVKKNFGRSNDSFYKEENPMCHEFEKLMNQKLEARETRGKLAAKRQMVINLHNQNMPIDQIAAVAEEPVETVMEWLQGLAETNTTNQHITQ